MIGINWKHCSWAMIPLVVISSHVYAERSGFYTIVGPDGRIMVIDRNAAVPAKANTDRKSEKKDAAQAAPVNTPAKPAVSVQADHVNASVSVIPKADVATAPATNNVASASDQPALPPTAKLPAAVHTPVKPLAATQSSTKPAAAVSSATGSAANTASGLPTGKSVPLQPLQAKIQQPAQPVAEVSDTTSPVTVIDGEQYIQSEYLEQKEFNLEGKKRFYSLPDGLGGTQVLQREKGVDMNVFKGPQIQVPKVVTLSKDYQRIDAKQVIQLTGVQCFTPEQLEKAKPLKEKATVDFWPRPSFEPKFDFVVAEFESEISDIELTSYAATSRNPVFYWPLPVFLDKNACVLEGVNAFYQRTLDANNMQHRALQGFLHVPQGAKYLLLTPLEAAADLSQVKLTNKGQVRLTPIR
jgi:hypothetical protein